MLKDLILKNRSYRRYEQSHSVSRETLIELIDLARQCPSAMNRQPLRYRPVATPEECAKVFPLAKWAALLGPEGTPKEGERPSAYIVILAEKDGLKHSQVDMGIAGQSILLAALEKGLGGIFIGSVKRDDLRQTLAIPEEYEILDLIALGKPAETVALEEMDSPDQTAYWRTEDGVHHVPKRRLEDVVVE